MASAIIHICVAKKVNEYLKFKEKELFLGAIAPDISKLINQTKIKSHFLSCISDLPNIDLFMHKYKSKIKTPFDYGYLIHLYTDKIWYFKLKKELDGDNNKIMDEKDGNIWDLYYNDYTNMNIKLIDKYSLDLSLFYDEFKTPDTCIKEIPIKKLNILVDKMGIIIANSRNKKTKILDYSKVLSFIDEVADEIVSFLIENEL